jgi:hypothetical protein
MPAMFGALVAVAMQAGKRQVVQVRLTTVLTGNDMIDFKWRRKKLLRDKTVLAMISGPGPNLSSKRGIHHFVDAEDRLACFRLLRAFE